MKTLIFATHNLHKISEVREILGQDLKILSLEDIHCEKDIPETSRTIAGNALQKARYVHKISGLNCFADDTGLEVSALNNAPGVLSARYAGKEKDSAANIQKILAALHYKTNRRAQFRTVIALIIDGKEKLFEGTVQGTITTSSRGVSGFGYDPIFIPDGYSETFSEMSASLKNKISHRAVAIRLLTEYLSEIR
ncbi:MAG: non-canonical purine NTP diphosphatase [Dysgonamonadaceae bacterium]|nr:non-canonical purine NTP diphosphatase [Dysgonamonadaceae bacterium]